MDPTPRVADVRLGHSKVRIRVENGSQRVKVFRIMKKHRDRLEYDRINDIICKMANQAILIKRDGIP